MESAVIMLYMKTIVLDGLVGRREKKPEDACVSVGWRWCGGYEGRERCHEPLRKRDGLASTTNGLTEVSRIPSSVAWLAWYSVHPRVWWD